MDINAMLFVDIETVPLKDSLLKLPKQLQEAWIKKATKKELDPAKSYLEDSSLYAEFAKICCISIGFFHTDTKGSNAGIRTFKVKSIFGSSEKAILTEFADVLKAIKKSLCGHNVKGFDFPFLSKRYVINQIEMPAILITWGKKPWELEHFVDTMELWKFGSFTGATSLDALCGALDVPTPKGDMDGSKVREHYFKGHWKKITDYCEKDVVATARCLQKMFYVTPIPEDQVMSLTKFKTND